MRSFTSSTILLVGCLLLSESQGSPISSTSFFQINSGGKTVIHHAQPHVIAKDEDADGFFIPGHPALGDRKNFPESSGKFGFKDAENYDEAVHAGRFGVELNRLERSDKNLHDAYIASAYYPSKFARTYELPHNLKRLAETNPSFEGGLSTFFTAGEIHDDGGPGFSFQDVSSIGTKSFPTIYHGSQFSDHHFQLFKERKGKVIFPESEGSRFVIKKSFPVFEKSF